MRALRRHEAQVRLDEVPEPYCEAPGDVLIAVQWAGLCRTDSYVADGRLSVEYPRVLGHEFSGRVLQVGAETSLRVGDAVACMPVIGCGACGACAKARPDRCPSGRFMGVDCDGAFAERIVVPAHALRALPASLCLQHAAYAEPLAAAMAVLEAGLSAGGFGVVVGAGRIAELTVRVMRAAGFEPKACASASALGRMQGLDYIVECQADAPTLQAAVGALRPGGTLVLKSRAAHAVPLPVATCVKKQLRIQGAAYAAFDEAIAWLVEGRVVLDDLFGASFALQDHAAMFEAGAQGEPCKLFLRPGI